MTIKLKSNCASVINTLPQSNNELNINLKFKLNLNKLLNYSGLSIPNSSINLTIQLVS